MKKPFSLLASGRVWLTRAAVCAAFYIAGAMVGPADLSRQDIVVSLSIGRVQSYSAVGVVGGLAAAHVVCAVMLVVVVLTRSRAAACGK